MTVTGLGTVYLLAIAVVVAIAARRLHLPYTVGLVVTGICLSVGHVGTEIALTHDFIFDVILPPLLFEAAIALHWTQLRKDAFPLLVLSTAGVVISALAVTFGMIAILGWPVSSAAIFGILIAATDPVSVIAMFKDTGVEGRLRLLVEGESLLNDGVAAVLFSLALVWVEQSGEATGPLQILQSLVQNAGGGVVVGLVVGGLAIVMVGRTADHLVETALTTVAAYGSFLLAEHFGVSGVLATVSAGLLMGNLGILGHEEENQLSVRGREFVVGFWDFAAFIANSLVFLIIGVTVAHVPFNGLGAWALAVSVALVLVGRALTVYPLCLLFSRSRWAIPIRKQHVLWWGGLRGALALALALALPASLPLRNDIVIATFGVVVFSVVVQGLTMKPLLRRLKLLPERP